MLTISKLKIRLFLFFIFSCNAFCESMADNKLDHFNTYTNCVGEYSGISINKQIKSIQFDANFETIIITRQVPASPFFGWTTKSNEYQFKGLLFNYKVQTDESSKKPYYFVKTLAFGTNFQKIKKLFINGLKTVTFELSLSVEVKSINVNQLQIQIGPEIYEKRNINNGTLLSYITHDFTADDVYTCTAQQ